MDSGTENQMGEEHAGEEHDVVSALPVIDSSAPIEQTRPRLVRRDSVFNALTRIEFDEPSRLPKTAVSTLSKVKTGIDTQVNLIRSLIGDDEKSVEKDSFIPVVFSTKVPSGSEESFKRLWSVARIGLGDLGITAELNLADNTMSALSTPDMKKDKHMSNAINFLKLLARGMEFNLAILALKDTYVCDFIKIGATVGTKEEFEKRRGRLIGPDGMTLKAIELLTKTFILVTGSVVCVLGNGYTGINTVGEIVHDCMNKIHPISHIRRLIIMQELQNHEKLTQKDWVRFVPPVKKNDAAEGGEGGQRTWGKIDFLTDDPADMTWSRQFALSLMEHEWYYPKIEYDQEPPTNIIEYDGGALPDGKSKETKSANEKSTETEVSEASSQAHFNSNLSLSNREGPPPKLEEAWAFFEHNVLPRHFVDFDVRKPNSVFERISNYRNQDFKFAPPGNNTSKTRLYSYILTPLSQMGDFGIGIGLYFTTLRSMIILMLVAGVIQIPNMIFYANKYSPSKVIGVDTFLEDVSALCQDHNFKPCPSCERKVFGMTRNIDRYANVTRDDGTNLHFAMKNDCDRSQILMIGMLNWLSILVLYAGIAQLNNHLEKMEVEFDEDEQTAQDYSIIVENPPKNAIDPEEWKEFFETVTGGHVTICTVGVDNDLLLATLIQRRLTIDKIKESLPVNTTLHHNDLAKLAAQTFQERTLFYRLFVTWLHPFGIALDLSELFNNFVQLTSKIRGLCQIKYNVTKVYITFETEKAQRIALSKLSIGRLEDKKKIKTINMFRGEKVLFLGEPEEPSTIRWEDLNAKMKKRITSSCITAICMIGAVVASFILVMNFNNRFGTNIAALCISLMNTVIPLFTKKLVGIEAHPNESSKQASMYWKITLFRWINTAVIFTASMPFTSTTMEGDDHLLSAIQKIFIADIITLTLIQILDPVGFINRHIRGPRAKTQLEMNKLFKGSAYELAERYTQTTKTVFLAFFYATIYPGGFFLASIVLLINYFLDSFSLMRTWAPAPKLGNSTSYLSRRYFFPLALVFLSIISSYYWSGFPFDNLCLIQKTSVLDEYLGNYTIYSQREREAGLSEHSVVVTPDTFMYKHCDQNFIRKNKFPFLPIFQDDDSRWMSKDQEKVAWVHAITSVVLLFGMLLFFATETYQNIKTLYRSDYEAQGKDMKIGFSDIEYAVTGYIPQVLNNNFLFPLVACDTDDFSEELFDWKDQENDYEHYSLRNDAKQIVGNGHDLSKVFSRMKHWLPPKKKGKNYDD